MAVRVHRRVDRRAVAVILVCDFSVEVREPGIDDDMPRPDQLLAQCRSRSLAQLEWVDHRVEELEDSEGRSLELGLSNRLYSIIVSHAGGGPAGRRRSMSEESC